ncbi:MAG: tetratricopeptide repeat protein, partial [Hallerella sp.]|nr:tetratricopeptide repeat protein [Hallerella sp.]
ELEAYVRLSKNETAIASAKNRIAELSGAEPKAPEAKPAEVKPAEVKPVEVTEPKPVEVPKPVVQKKQTNPTMDLANDAYRQGDYASALAQYQALQKKSRDENTKAYLLFQIGNVYRCRRDFRSAVAKYREAVEYYPNSEWANEAQRAWEDAVWQEKNANALPRR